MAQEQFTKIDTEVRGDMDIVIGQKAREISIVVAEVGVAYCLFESFSSFSFLSTRGI